MKLDFSKVTGTTIPETIKTTNEPREVEIIPGTYDLESVKELIKTYVADFKLIRDKADALQVKDDKTAATCTEMIAQLSKAKKRLEETRKKKIKKEDAFVRDVNAVVKIVRDKIEFLIHTLKQDKLNPYSYKVELKRREDENKQKAAAAEVQRKLDAEAKEKNVEPITMPKMTIPKKAAPIRTEIGTSSTLMVWTYEVEDLSKIPRDFLVLNESMVKKSIAAGIRKINGIKIFEKADTRVRTN